MTATRRRSGLLVPLFSAPSSRSWGIGDIGDISPLCEWLAGAGQRILQFLPLNEMAWGAHSPYSALSAMAIDPVYIRVTDVDEYRANGCTLSDEDRTAVEAAQNATRVDYRTVRDVKHRALAAAFDRFVDEHWRRNTERAGAMRAWCARESWWLDDYGLFRAIHERENGRAWTDWPESLRHREPAAMAAARSELDRGVLFARYLQWLADTQWADAREAARAYGVALFGDLPFMVDTHSADVWAHQSQFNIDRSVGVPPDAFSASGQDWGMPPYDWDGVARSGYAWLADRARRSAALFDGYRVDHLVGFYRTYSRPRSGEGEPSFQPATEPEQRELGEHVLGLFGSTGADIIAEDLGTVPDFVRASLDALGLPGYRVLRWEREWEVHGRPFRDPLAYPVASVATTGTHDTEPQAVWWMEIDAEERAAIAAIPSIAARTADIDLATAAYDTIVRDILLETLVASGSEYVLFPIQDVFGWHDRINEPATVNDSNWTYRLPWFVDRLGAQPAAVERQATLREWADRYGRR